MSLICAIVNPSSACGRFGSGTSTFTMRARRRAFSNPTSVATVAIPENRFGRESQHLRHLRCGQRERCDQQCHVTQQREDEQRGEKSHDEQADRRETIGPLARLHRARVEAQRDREEGDDQQEDARQRAAKFDGKIGQESPADIPVSESQNCQEHEETTSHGSAVRR